MANAAKWMKVYRIWRSDFLQQHVSRVLPPFLLAGARYLFPEMTYEPRGWHLQNAGSEGWYDGGVAQAQERHWPTLVNNLQGAGPLGVAHFPWSVTREDRANHNAMMSYGYVLALAARKKDKISILDWGGGAGHYYLYTRALIPGLQIDYHCYDVPALCKVGERLLPEVRFHDTDADLASRQFDLVLCSSALHYFEEWRKVARELAGLTREFLYIARLQTVLRVPSFVALHRLYRDGYSEFLSWCLNQQELIACIEEAGLQLVREFVFGEPWTVRGVPEKVDSRGFLFQRRQ
jgi:putative methyltransferase (TIGR04325 family)